MQLKDQFRYLVGGYYGIEYIDDYPLKVYILKEVEKYIRAFLEENPIEDFNYKKEAEIIKEKLSERTKLQDALIVLQKINASMELIFLIKKRLKLLDKK